MERPKTSLSTHLAVAAAALALVASSPPLAAQIPSEVAEGLPSSEMPQGKADLARTTSLVYGRDLSPGQLAEIESWKPQRPDWWLAPSHDLTASNRLQEIEELAGGLGESTTLGQLAAHEAMFGVEVGTSTVSVSDDLAAQTAEVPVLTVRPSLRPDLWSLAEQLSSFLANYVEQYELYLLGSGTGAGTAVADPFLQFGYERPCQEGIVACPVPSMSSSEFAALAGALVDSVGTYNTAELDRSSQELILLLSGLAPGQSLPASELRRLEEELNENVSELQRLEATTFFGALPPDLRTAVVKQVTRSIGDEPVQLLVYTDAARALLIDFVRKSRGL